MHSPTMRVNFNSTKIAVQQVDYHLVVAKEQFFYKFCECEIDSFELNRNGIQHGVSKSLNCRGIVLPNLFRCFFIAASYQGAQSFCAFKK